MHEQFSVLCCFWSPKLTIFEIDRSAIFNYPNWCQTRHTARTIKYSISIMGYLMKCFVVIDRRLHTQSAYDQGTFVNINRTQREGKVWDISQKIASDYVLRLAFSTALSSISSHCSQFIATQSIWSCNVEFFNCYSGMFILFVLLYYLLLLFLDLPEHWMYLLRILVICFQKHKIVGKTTSSRNRTVDGKYCCCLFFRLQPPFYVCRAACLEHAMGAYRDPHWEIRLIWHQGIVVWLQTKAFGVIMHS